MRGITLTQPWASLLALGVKRLETRSWATQYRGPLLIHASAHVSPETKLALRAGGAAATLTALGWDWRVLPRGSVLAVGRLVDVLPTLLVRAGTEEELADPACPAHVVSEQELALGFYGPDRFAWVVRDVQPVTPIPAKGRLGLWMVSNHLRAALRLQGVGA